MTTAAQALVNAANARKSTGPVTLEGKARSSRNALRHGLTATEIVLPGEDPAAFDDEMDAWLDHYRPSDPARRAAVERAVVSKWKLDRCARVEAERLAERVRHAADRHDLDRFADAEETGRRLILDPINRTSPPPHRDPDFGDRVEARLADNPAVLARRLQATAQGADWLIARWTELGAMLETHGTWFPAERLRALWLLGRHPEDVMEDALVRAITFASDAGRRDRPDPTADPERLNLWDDCNQPKITLDGRAMPYAQFEALRPIGPADATAARALLAGVVAGELSRLGALKRDHLNPNDRLDRLGAARMAMFDDTKEGTLLRRYEAALEKEYHRSVADLKKPLEPPAACPESGPPETAPVAPLPNEPTTEVIAVNKIVSKQPATRLPERAAPVSASHADRPESRSGVVFRPGTAPDTVV